MYLPRSDSARIIVGTWWLVVLVVVTTYCGNLVAFLTFPKIDTPISTVGQLLNSEGVTWGLRSDTYLQQYLKVGLVYSVFTLPLACNHSRAVLGRRQIPTSTRGRYRLRGTERRNDRTGSPRQTCAHRLEIQSTVHHEGRVSQNGQL